MPRPIDLDASKLLGCLHLTDGKVRRIVATATAGRNKAPLLAAAMNRPDVLAEALSELLSKDVPVDAAQHVLRRFNERSEFERRSDLFLPVCNNNRDWAQYFVYAGEIPPEDDEEQLTGRDAMRAEVDAILEGFDG